MDFIENLSLFAAGKIVIAMVRFAQFFDSQCIYCRPFLYIRRLFHWFAPPRKNAQPATGNPPQQKRKDQAPWPSSNCHLIYDANWGNLRTADGCCHLANHSANTGYVNNLSRPQWK